MASRLYQKGASEKLRYEVFPLVLDQPHTATLIDGLRGQCGLCPARVKSRINHERQKRIDRWADHLRQSLSLELIRGWIGRRA